MYTVIFENGSKAVNLSPDEIVSEDELSLALNAKPLLTLTLYPEFEAWDFVRKDVTAVKLLDIRTNKIKFCGRVTEIEDNIDSSGRRYRKIACGGNLDFLEDTTPEKYFGDRLLEITVKEAAERLISIHNEKADKLRQFTLGQFNEDIAEKKIRISRKDIGFTTYEWLKGIFTEHRLVYFIDDFPAQVIYGRYENGTNYIDIVPTVGKKSGTVIKLGDNLTGIKAVYPVNDHIVTRVYPVSKWDLDAKRITIENAPENKTGKPYLEDEELVSKYGVREEILTDSLFVMHWDIYFSQFDISLQEYEDHLYEIGVEFLAKQKQKEQQQNSDVQITLSALDLKKAGYDGYDEFEIGNTHSVICPKLGILRDMRITALKYKLADAKNTSLTFSTDGTANYSKTVSNSLQTLSNAVSSTNETQISISSYLADSMVGRKGTAEGAEYFNDYTNNIASGNYSHAEGYNCEASENSAHAEGHHCKATGVYGSHAEGYACTAGGWGAHAEGGMSEARASRSHAEGNGCFAFGNSSHAEGSSTHAYGMHSHTEGNGTMTGNQVSSESSKGANAHAEGFMTVAEGNYSHAEGRGTPTLEGEKRGIARGVCSHVENDKCVANGTASHAEGTNTTAQEFSSHSEGFNTTAQGAISHAEGNATKAIGYTSHAEGVNSIANGDYSHAEGYSTTANGSNTHAEGNQTTAGGANSHTEGSSTSTSENAQNAHAEGSGTKAEKNNAHAEGSGTTASGDSSHAEGGGTTASGASSHSEGGGTRATGDFAHSEGGGTTASGNSSHAEGGGSTASGGYSHAEGGSTTASGDNAHSEGAVTKAIGKQSHAEGTSTAAEGDNSHAEGVNTTAAGGLSHAEGYGTKAQGFCSHAGGNSTVAGYSNQTVIGQFNDNKSDTLFEIGCGADDDTRTNIIEVTPTAAKVNGELYVGGAQIGLGLVKIARADYDALETYSDITVYFVTEDDGAVNIYLGAVKCGI